MKTLDTGNIKYNPKTFKKDLKNYRDKTDNLFYIKADLSLDSKSLVKLRKKFETSTVKNIPSIVYDIFKTSTFSVERIGDTKNNHIIYLLTVKNKKYILKTNFLSDYLKEFNFLKEVKLSEVLSSEILPEYLIADISQEKYPFDFMIEKYVDGRTMVKNVSSVEFINLGKNLKRIHSVKTNNFGNINLSDLILNNKIIGSYKFWDDFILLNLNDHISYSIKTKVINIEKGNKLIALYEENKKLFKDVNSVLLHNDPSLKNTVVYKSKIKIIDWEDAICGDNLWDIAFIESFLYRDNKGEIFKNFCTGYGIKSEEIKKNKKYNLYYLRILLFKIKIKSKSGVYKKNDKKIDLDRMSMILNRLEIN